MIGYKITRLGRYSFGVMYLKCYRKSFTFCIILKFKLLKVENGSTDKLIKTFEHLQDIIP